MPKKRDDSWPEDEVRAAVASYLRMLSWELEGTPFVKSHENSALRKRLNGRSPGSVEFKHQNISAVLVRMGLRPIQGYKPAANSQGILTEVVTTAIEENPSLFSAAREAFNVEDWRWLAPAKQRMGQPTVDTAH